MPKAPLAAQILIVLFAILVIAYSVSAIHLSEDSAGKRFALPGQLVVVQMHSSWTSMDSSDHGVLAPISVTLKPTARAYFIALKPGTATLRADFSACRECLSLVRGWWVEIEVRPG
jgi:ABC-type phosphate transport system permease subunit